MFRGPVSTDSTLGFLLILGFVGTAMAELLISLLAVCACVEAEAYSQAVGSQCRRDPSPQIGKSEFP